MQELLLAVNLQNDYFSDEYPLIIPDDFWSSLAKVLNESPMMATVMEWHHPTHYMFAKTYNKQPGDIIPRQQDSVILQKSHCVAFTEGANLIPAVKPFETKMLDTFFTGTNKAIDNYHIFYDKDNLRTTGLKHFLDKNHFDTIAICGCPVETTIKLSVINALDFGYKVKVYRKACVGLNTEAIDKAFESMEKAGATIVG